MSNYPAGVSQGDIDALCMPTNSLPNREECFLCKSMIQQQEDFGWWFIEDVSGWVPTHKADSTDAFQTEQGWCCSTDCWNENCALNEEPHASDCSVWVKEPCSCVTGKGRLFLIGGAA